MKHLKFILLAASMIVTMMTIALVSTQAKTEDDVVGASVPPNYQFNSIKTINIRNDTNSPAKYYICDNPEGSVEMTRLNKNLCNLFGGGNDVTSDSLFRAATA